MFREPGEPIYNGYVAITCNSVSTSIGQNLHDALARLYRIKSNDFVWVDALCIDQSSNLERGQQVPLMVDIFSGAIRVIAWVGIDESGFEACLSLVQNEYLFYGVRILYAEKLYTQARNLLIPHGSGDIPERFRNQWVAFFAFFAKRRYFSRAWIMQELLLAKRAEIWCGEHTISWERIEMILFHLQLHRGWAHICPRDSVGLLMESMRRATYLIRDETWADWHSMDGLKDLSSIHMFSWSSVVKEHGLKQGPLVYLERLLGVMFEFDASENHDRIYAILGLFAKKVPPNVKIPIPIDYELSFEWLWIRTAYFVLKYSPTCYILSRVVSEHQDPSLKLPSWCPNPLLRTRSTSLQLRLRDRRYDCSGVASLRRNKTLLLDGGTLITQGLAFDVIQETVPSLETSGRVEVRAWVSSLLTLLEGMHETYQNGQSRLEALWWTIELGEVDESTRSLPAQLQFFYWIFQACVWHPSEGSQYLSKPDLSLGFSSLIGRHFGGPAGSAIKSLYANQASSDSDLVGRLRTASNISIPSPEYLRVFRTVKGSLGNGNRALAPGDQVWLSRDFELPLVLRPRPYSTVYEFVGLTYLHGFMNGEMLDEKWGLKDKMANVRIT